MTKKAQAYLPPFFLPTDGMATRTFADCVQSDSHQFGQHPHDYTLFCVGTFDDSAGQFIINERSQMLGNGVEFIKTPNLDSANGSEIPQTEVDLEERPSIQPSSES